MRKFVVFILLTTVSVALAAFPKDDSEMQAKGRAIIERGVKVGDLLDPSVMPFVLRGVNMAKGQNHKFIFYWAPPNYRSEVPGTQDVQDFLVGNASEFWEKNRTPLGFDLMDTTMQVVDVVAPLRTAMQERVTRLRDRKEKDVALQCVTTRSKEIRERESCFDPQTGVLVSMKTTHEIKSPFGGPLPTYVKQFQQMTVNYSEFEVFGTKLYPRVVEFVFQGAVFFRRRIDSLKPLEAADPSLFQREPNSVRWDWCVGMSMPRLEADVSFDDDPGKNVKTGRVKLVITEEGKYDSGEVLEEKNVGDGLKILGHYSRQQFVPAKCGDKMLRGRMIVTYRQY